MTKIALLGAGGKLNIKTGGDATFEGTDIAGGEGVDLAAGGNVAFNEAVSTSSSLDVGVGVGVGMEKSSEVDGESGDKTDSPAPRARPSRRPRAACTSWPE